MHSPLLSAIPGLRYGFGHATQLIPAALQAYWHHAPDKTQVHGNHIVEIVTPGQLCGEADGFYTRQAGIPVTVVTADCVPVLFARKDGRAVAAVHAGWRGLRYGIIEALWARLSAEGERPDEWVAAIGAHIGHCCYEVSAELMTDFMQTYPELSALSIQPRERYLNLNAVTELILRRTGIEQIDNLQKCTRCACEADGQPRFRSYRRGDRQSHQHTGLVIVA